jgi:H+-translocating NAD(P) transhydrogenase subunit alpha
MIIGFCKSEMDIKCPISPAIAKKYVKDGWEIWIEQGLGEIINANYEGGVTEKSRDEILAGADVVYANRFSNLSELASVNKASMVVSNFRPYENATVSEELKKYGFKASSMDMIPRTTLAQSMDVLSSMASIAGYKAVIKGADLLQKYLPMMMTAAGTIKPSKILILGAGVAGLQAIATAKRMGAKVEVFDVRKAVKEEVQSLGGTFVEVEGSTDDKGAGGYAVEQTDEYKQKQKELIAKHVKGADIVIATAQLRGKRAPILVSQEMVDAMEKGSVIIDLASSSGGNCEVTQDGKVIDYKGIKVMGNSFLENDMILDSSSLLSSNIYNYLKIFVKEGQLNFDMENEIINGSIINK